MDRYGEMKARLAGLRAALYDFEPARLRAVLEEVVAADAPCRYAHPLGEVTGPGGVWDKIYAPLAQAVPDLERRDHIVIAGPDHHGGDWVGTGGWYTGTFVGPWLDIPPTGHILHMRFHEFYRVEGDRVTEIQALWDLPEVMMQAGVWPMGPSLGREWHVPAPAGGGGIVPAPRDAARSEAACAHVVEMLNHMKRHPSKGGPEVMEMDRFWHPRMMWYGPSGIGSGRGIAGFRHWHQIPFLNAMPDRGQYLGEITYHFFGDGDFVGVTGWPNMIQTITHDGWLGIAPSGQRVSMKSLDFWRLENGLIRENWVMVDLLDMWHQIGVDVLARMREFNKVRPGFDPATGRAR